MVADGSVFSVLDFLNLIITLLFVCSLLFNSLRNLKHHNPNIEPKFEVIFRRVYKCVSSSGHSSLMKCFCVRFGDEQSFYKARIDLLV
jgi:hypothetical protein